MARRYWHSRLHRWLTYRRLKRRGWYERADTTHRDDP
jgi:hypothetical protein